MYVVALGVTSLAFLLQIGGLYESAVIALSTCFFLLFFCVLYLLLCVCAPVARRVRTPTASSAASAPSAAIASRAETLPEALKNIAPGRDCTPGASASWPFEGVNKGAGGVFFDEWGSTGFALDEAFLVSAVGSFFTIGSGGTAFKASFSSFFSMRCFGFSATVA